MLPRKAGELSRFIVTEGAARASELLALRILKWLVSLAPPQSPFGRQLPRFAREHKFALITKLPLLPP